MCAAIPALHAGLYSCAPLIEKTRPNCHGPGQAGESGRAFHNAAASLKLSHQTMRIIYLDADFESLTGETGPRSYAFARRLIDRGHEVRMLTSDRRYASAIAPGSPRVFDTAMQGVPVTVLNCGLGRPSGVVRRIRRHLAFAFAATRWLLNAGRADVLLATSPPLSVVIPAVLTRWFRKLPYVLEVREIWPEVPRGLGLLRSKLLYRLLRVLAVYGYRRAAHLIALSDPAAHHIAADIPLSRKITRIPPCCDLALFGSADGTAIRRRQGWEGKFVCLHVGPIVRATGLEAILRVADAVREDEQFVFWLVGRGDQRAEIEANIRDRELKNVVLWDPPPHEGLPEIIAAADLCLSTVRRYRVLEQTSGERLFDYLAAGKPVLLNYGGWQRDLLERNRAGLGTELGHYGEFYNAVCRLCDDRALREDMSRNARSLAETQFHPDRWIDLLEQVLTQAAAPGGGGAKETGDRKQETGVRSQETGDKKPEGDTEHRIQNTE